MDLEAPDPGSWTAKDVLHTAANIGLGGGWWFRQATHVILVALLVEGNLTDRVQRANPGATLRLGVEAGLERSERMMVRLGTCALLTMMAGYLLSASVITHKLWGVFLAAQLAVPATDPLHEVIQDVI